MRLVGFGCAGGHCDVFAAAAAVSFVVWLAIVFVFAVVVLVGFGYVSGRHAVFVEVVVVSLDCLGSRYLFLWWWCWSVIALCLLIFSLRHTDDVVGGVDWFRSFFSDDEGQCGLMMCSVRDFATCNCRKSMGILCGKRRILGIH